MPYTFSLALQVLEISAFYTGSNIQQYREKSYPHITTSEPAVCNAIQQMDKSNRDSAAQLMLGDSRACSVTRLQIYRTTAVFPVTSSRFSQYRPLHRTLVPHITSLYSAHITQHEKVCVCVKLRGPLLKTGFSKAAAKPLKEVACSLHVDSHDLSSPCHWFITLSLLLAVQRGN